MFFSNEKFSFHPTGDRITKICGEAKIKCYKEAEKLFSIKINLQSIYDKCNCLPPCTLIEYNAKIDRVPIEYDKKSYRVIRKSELTVFFWKSSS